MARWNLWYWHKSQTVLHSFLAFLVKPIIIPTMNKRRPRNHIIIIDGTQSKLDKGHETNAGILFRLLEETPNARDETLWYHPGVQGHGLWNWITIASGLGINATIRQAYARLSSQYRSGDKIYLFGFSRGAYAVRSLAGMIAQLGLLRRKHAIERRVTQAFRLYECKSSGVTLRHFVNAYTNRDIPIEMIGVWDTVKALGLSYPLLSRLAPMATEFHNDKIGGGVKNGFHALALDETRNAYAPVLWDVEFGWNGHLEQVWFRGAHSDIGGHVWKFPDARPLSNIPLVWMLEKAEECGLLLPTDWRDRFVLDPTAPAKGDKRGIAKFFLLRSKRIVGAFPCEKLHPSVGDQAIIEPYHATSPKLVTKI
ncbi:hypothetical protein BFP76_08145 [Amylibacter kogurei]|uniref:T6SS Phospholipase effector Tle1-like catalytic domain-containing protein n=1 Tax=Paramylibacter kogurei TaxID=1889778 RepID=A0A2G5K3A2_9RHOB|nr:DUF2235 domain-containing protein [Amylibacter kogurei]PIB23502.1 hypothetical protein BFP76_08145 [Amylibacter kogurei]